MCLVMGADNIISLHGFPDACGQACVAIDVQVQGGRDALGKAIRQVRHVFARFGIESIRVECWSGFGENDGFSKTDDGRSPR